MFRLPSGRHISYHIGFSDSPGVADDYWPDLEDITMPYPLSEKFRPGHTQHLKNKDI
jgi:hypothetical protein